MKSSGGWPSETLAPDDAALIAAALDMVTHHEERNEFADAKAVFTYMMESMSWEMHGHSTSVILRERKLEITMKYHAFLHRHDRTEEAQNILVGVWTQYREALDVTQLSETEMSVILTVGRTMKKHRSLETAQTIFQSLWSYFKRVDQRSTSLAIETAQSLSITSKEIIEVKMSRTTTMEETTTVSTSELEDIFSSLTSTTTSSSSSSSSWSSSSTTISDTTKHGCRLVAFLQHHGRTEESERFEMQLRSHFAGALDSTDPSTALQDFFDICVRETGSTSTDPLDTVIAAAAAAVRRHLDDTGSCSGFDLASLVHRFLKLLQISAANIQTALQLALWLAGRGGARKHMDKKLSQKMRDLSAELLRDVLRRTDLAAVAAHMPLHEPNDVAGLLGELREWEALETILTTAWSTRTASSHPLTIGLRLAQIRFLLHPQHDRDSSSSSSSSCSIRLAGDIAYNSLQFWGVGDSSTRRAFAVFSALLVAAGERARAADVLIEAFEGLLDAVAAGECPRADAARWVGEVWGNSGGGGAMGFGGRECELSDGGGGQKTWVGLKGRLEAELGLGLGGGGWERGKPAGQDPVCGFATAEGRKAREEEEDERGAGAWGIRARGRHGREEAWMPESWEFLEKGEETVHRNNLRKTSGLDGRVRTPFVVHMDKARVPSLSVGSESATTDDEVLGWGDGQLPALREIGQGKGHKVESEEYMMKKLDDGLAGDHFFRMHV